MHHWKLGIAALALLVGCTPIPGGTSNTNNSDRTSPSASAAPFTTSMGIVGAKSLFIAGGEEGPARYRAMSTSNESILYRLNADNSVVRVSVTNADGQATMQEISPIVMASTPNFIYLSLRNQHQGCYLVRKSNGKVAKVSDHPYFGQQHGNQPIAEDHAGNLYMIVGDSVNHMGKLKLVKVAGAGIQEDSNTLVQTALTNLSFEQSSNAVIVNPDGDAMVMVSPVNNNQAKQTRRIYRANGGTVNAGLSSWYGGIDNWVGSDGAFYTFHGGDGNKIQRITLDATGAVSAEQVPGTETVSLSPTVSAVIGDRTVFADTFNSHNGNKLYVFQGMGFAEHSLSNVAQINTMEASGEHVIVSGVDSLGNSILEKVDPVTGQETKLFSDTSYQLFGFSVSREGEVTVSALRMADNTYVFGTLGNGTISAITSSLPKVQSILTLQ